MPIIQALLAHSANPNALDNDGETALIRAARRGHLNIVRALIRAGADVNLRGEYSSPLCWATIKNHVAVAGYLIAHGADVNQRNRDGETAIERARIHGHSQIAQLLKRAGAKG
jgi:ankyrin repeat protein